MLGRLNNLSKRSLLGWSRLIVLAFFIYVLFLWQLGTLTRGFSPAEVFAQTSSSSLQAIIDNPVNAPHKILQYAVQRTAGRSAFDLRIISVVFALLFLFSFYQLVRSWFGKMIGFFSTVFLAATPWFILLARSATPAILLLAPIVIIAGYYWFKRRRDTKAFMALTAAIILGIYVPGVVWLLLIGYIVSRRKLRASFVDIKRINKIAVFLLSIIFISPLIYASIKNPRIIQDLFLIPADWLSLLVLIKSIAWSTLALFWRAPVHIDFIIGRLPVINLTQAILALFGVFALWRLARSKLYALIILFVFAVIAAGLNRDLILLTLALPALAITTAAGLRYLYLEWRNVFPKNPIPKYLAIFLIAALAVLHVVYGIRYSLVAWPNTTATRTTYMLK